MDALTIYGDPYFVLGDFAAYLTYMLQLTWPIIALGWVINLFQRGAASMDRIRQILDEAPTIACGLLNAGLGASTPVAVIENGTRADMRVATGPLSQLPALAVKTGSGPSLIIVGEVVRLSGAWPEPALLAAE